MEEHNRILTGMRESAEKSDDKTLSSKLQDILESLVVGQRTILDTMNTDRPILDTTAALDQFRLQQEDMSRTLLSALTYHTDHQFLKDELVVAQEKMSALRLDHQALNNRYDNLCLEQTSLKDKLDNTRTETTIARLAKEGMRKEQKSALAGQMAAEQERDSFARALRESVAETSRLSGEISYLRKEVSCLI